MQALKLYDRTVNREKNASMLPLTAVIVGADFRIPVKIVNYHAFGACLKLDGHKEIEKKSLSSCELELSIGKIRTHKNLKFRLAWTDDSGLIGIQFAEDGIRIFNRALRTRLPKFLVASVQSIDPLEPQRRIYLRVQDLSTTGMLLATSLSNKHLLPGMSLKKSTLSLPDLPDLAIELTIQNCQVSSNGQEFLIGASVSKSSAEYSELVTRFLKTTGLLALSESSTTQDLQTLRKIKTTSKFLTFRIIEKDEDYQRVLQLRFDAYRAHGKTLVGESRKDQGKGLAEEGIVLGAFLGSKLVGSVEIRLSDRHSLRLLPYLENHNKTQILTSKVLEINKLAIHPAFSGSDVLIGIIQKIHYIGTINDSPTVLLCATDKLVPLYLRAGAEQMGIRFEHPKLANQFLNIMTIQKETYQFSKDMNPYSWSLIYKAVSDYMNEIGLLQPSNWSFREKLLYSTTKTFVSMRNILVKILPPPKNTSDRETKEKANSIDEKADKINPQLLKQHVSTSVALPYVLASDQILGESRTNEILNTLQITRKYLEDPTYWVSSMFFDLFFEHFTKFSSISKLAREAAKISFSPKRMGIKYYLMKLMKTPQHAFARLPEMMNRLNRTRVYDVVELTRQHAVVKVSAPDRSIVSNRREICENWELSIKCFNKLVSGAEGEVVKESCIFDGAEACTYRIKWPLQTNAIKTNLTRSSHLFATVGSIVSIFFLYTRSNAMLALVLGTLSCIYSFIILLLKRTEVSSLEREIQKNYEQFDEKFEEIQNARESLAIRCRELQLLESATKEIQRHADLSAILNGTLQELVKSFDFSRAILMLANPEEQLLRTAAIAGIETSLDKVWAFKVDYSLNRAEKIFVSSVFRSSQSILISDVSEYLDIFNESSQYLLKQLGIMSFTVVPIPSNAERNWGVIIAERGREKGGVKKPDVEILERVALSLGLVLDKQHQLDNERNLKEIYSKYVPFHVVESLKGIRSTTLGAVSREVVCMFLDVRQFTKLSSTLPATSVVEIINRVGQKVYDMVTPSGGYIEKYLGDGVLVSWGSINNNKVNYDNAINSVVGLVLGFSDVNEHLTSIGLPAIEIGIGVHAGAAIVGNVGAANRLEFTSMGLTINIASRLQDLCKTLDATVVISDALYEKLDETQRAKFSATKSATLRGVEGDFLVHCIYNGKT